MRDKNYESKGQFLIHFSKNSGWFFIKTLSAPESRISSLLSADNDTQKKNKGGNGNNRQLR